jgi:uncharacterized membrane protein
MLTLWTIIISLIPTILKGIPGISSTIQQIISDITASVAAILGSGAVTQPNVTTIMSAWAGVVAALQKDPNLPATSLAAVAELEKIVQAVLTQDAVLAKGIDWTKLQPITPGA